MVTAVNYLVIMLFPFAAWDMVPYNHIKVRQLLCKILPLPLLRFGRCEICYLQSRQIAGSESLEVKLAAVKTLRQHLHDQFVDRSIQWSLNELSRDYSSQTLVILTDGIDQAKFRLPKHPGLRAVSSMLLDRVASFFPFSVCFSHKRQRLSPQNTPHD